MSNTDSSIEYGGAESPEEYLAHEQWLEDRIALESFTNGEIFWDANVDADELDPYCPNYVDAEEEILQFHWFNWELEQLSTHRS